MDRQASNLNCHQTSNNRSDKGCRPLREYSRGQESVHNRPYVAMIVLGAATFLVGFEKSVWGWIVASAYLMYGMIGTLWIIIFLYPYCQHYNTAACPCGYGRIAARLRKKNNSDRFKEKFKKHISVIVPLWLIPILAGIALMIRSFSWPLFVLLIVFALDAFIVLLLFST